MGNQPASFFKKSYEQLWEQIHQQSDPFMNATYGMDEGFATEWAVLGTITGSKDTGTKRFEEADFQGPEWLHAGGAGMAASTALSDGIAAMAAAMQPSGPAGGAAQHAQMMARPAPVARGGK